MTVQRTRTKQQWHGALCAESDLGREVGDGGVRGHVNRRCGRGSGCKTLQKHATGFHPFNAERLRPGFLTGRRTAQGLVSSQCGVTPRRSLRLVRMRRRRTTRTMAFPGCETASAQLQASEAAAGSATTFLQLFCLRFAKRGQRPLEAGRGKGRRGQRQHANKRQCVRSTPLRREVGFGCGGEIVMMEQTKVAASVQASPHFSALVPLRSGVKLKPGNTLNVQRLLHTQRSKVIMQTTLWFQTKSQVLFNAGFFRFSPYFIPGRAAAAFFFCPLWVGVSQMSLIEEEEEKRRQLFFLAYLEYES